MDNNDKDGEGIDRPRTVIMIFLKTPALQPTDLIPTYIFCPAFREQLLQQSSVASVKSSTDLPDLADQCCGSCGAAADDGDSRYKCLSAAVAQIQQPRHPGTYSDSYLLLMGTHDPSLQ